MIVVSNPKSNGADFDTLTISKIVIILVDDESIKRWLRG